jgi:hypothetical protein
MQVRGEAQMVNTPRIELLARAVRWIVLACIACMVAYRAFAAEPAGLSGTYRYVPERSSDISQAIDATVAKMNFIKRPIARGRLARTNAPYQQIRIQVDAAEVELSFDDRKPLRLPLDGRPVKWTRDDGEVFDVSARVEGVVLVQTYQAEDGARVNTFELEADGRLSLKVEVSSPQLPQRMRYELVYQAI